MILDLVRPRGGDSHHRSLGSLLLGGPRSSDGNGNNVVLGGGGQGNSAVSPSTGSRNGGGEFSFRDEGRGGVLDALGQGGDTRAGDGGSLSVSGDENVTGVSNIVTLAVSGHTGSNVMSALCASGFGVQLGSGGLALGTFARRTNPESGRADVAVRESVREGSGTSNKALSRSFGGLVGSSFETKVGLG